MPPAMPRNTPGTAPSTAPSRGRLRRLATLDAAALDDLRTNPAATVPALLVAVLGLLALGVGGWLWWVASGLGDTGGVFVKTVGLGTAFGLVGWLVWLLVIYLVMRQLAGVILPVEELLRMAGFAAAPLLLALAMVVPAVSFGVGLVALAGWVAATQLAVERTAGRGGIDVMLANLAGFAAWAVMMSLLSSATNQIGGGPFLAESIWDAVTGVEGFLP